MSEDLGNVCVYLCVNLTKIVKSSIENTIKFNWKTLKKRKIKWRSIMLMTGRSNNLSTHSSPNWSTDLVPIKISTGVFEELGKLTLNLYGKVESRQATLEEV